MSFAETVFAVVGPSGAGKDTLIKAVLQERPDLRLIRRVITRPTEAGGEDFEGISEAEFATRLRRGDFALHWQAHGLWYGLPKAQLAAPGNVIFNGSRAALAEAFQVFPSLRVILVTAPDAILASRLAARGRESKADIAQRLTRAAFTLPAGITAETVVNDADLETGIARLLAALHPVKA